MPIVVIQREPSKFKVPTVPPGYVTARIGPHAT